MGFTFDIVCLFYYLCFYILVIIYLNWFCLFLILFVLFFIFRFIFAYFSPQNFTHHDVYGHLQNGLPWPRSWTTSCPFPRASPRKFPPLPGGTEKTGSCRTDWPHTSWSGGAALVRSWSWQPRRKWPVPRTDRSRS